MLSTSPQVAIQRFTYDWLIRFCELHITKPRNFVETDIRVKILNSHVEPDTFSMFCMSNSLFATLAERYTPLVIKGNGRWFQKSTATFPKGKKIVIIGAVVFKNLLPGSLTNYLHRKIYFIPDRVVTMNSVISPDEFTYLLKPCKSFVPWNKTSLSKPVLCSELWPLLGHCTFLNFDIDNFIYDDKMSQMLSCMPCDIAKLYLYKIGLREDIVFPIVALFLKLLIKHVKLSFCHDDSNQSCESMAAVIEKKFKAAGFRVEKRNESRLNRTIEIRMPRDYEVYVAFYD